jgi:hypothetical protein
VDRLQTVVHWTPEEGQVARPFEALDILYTGIVSAAKELYESIDTNRGRNFLLLLKAHRMNSSLRIPVGLSHWKAFHPPSFDELLNLERGAHEILVSDLHSLVVFPEYPSIGMHFYHRSFGEFLDSEIRAKNLFVPEMQVNTYILEVIVQRISRISLNPSESPRAPAMYMYTYFPGTRATWDSGRVFLDALQAFCLYSNYGETLTRQQLLCLSHNDGWAKFDQIQMLPVLRGDKFYGEPFLKTTSIIVRRLKVSSSPQGSLRLLADYIH